MASASWSDLGIRVWDTLTEHPLFVTPICFIACVACSVSLWRIHPSGTVGLVTWALAILLGGLTLLFPLHGWSENYRMDARLRTVSEAENQVITALLERDPILITWLQNPGVASLLRDGILEKLPTTLDNGLQTFGLTRRAKSRALKTYSDKIL